MSGVATRRGMWTPINPWVETHGYHRCLATRGGLRDGLEPFGKRRKEFASSDEAKARRTGRAGASESIPLGFTPTALQKDAGIWLANEAGFGYQTLELVQVKNSSDSSNRRLIMKVDSSSDSDMASEAHRRNTMFSFWHSEDTLSREGFKLAWLGVVIGIVGLFVPDIRILLTCIGIIATSIGLVLKHRSEKLKDIEKAPRKLTQASRNALQDSLKKSVKGEISVHFFGPDAEAKQYAEQIVEVVESAGFCVKDFSGMYQVQPWTGIHLEVVIGDPPPVFHSSLESALRIAGLDCETHVIHDKRRTSCVSVTVSPKPKPNLRNGRATQATY